LDYGLKLDDLNEDSVKKVRNMMKAAQHKHNMPPIYSLRKN